MKLIIDIPDYLYKLLKDFPSDSDESTIENVLMKAVENGTPIPDNATVCDIEQIRTEIEQIDELKDYPYDRVAEYVKAEVLQIIAKYTK